MFIFAKTEELQDANKLVTLKGDVERLPGHIERNKEWKQSFFFFLVS